MPLKERLVVAGSIQARDDAQDRERNVTVHLARLEAAHRFFADVLIGADRAEGCDDERAQLGREFSLAGARVPAEAGELGCVELARLLAQRRSRALVEGAIGHVKGGGHELPGIRFVLVTEASRDGEELLPGDRVREQG